MVTFGTFTLDNRARQLSRGAEPIHLSPKAFDLLALLVQRRPEAISKAQILDTLWPDTFVSEGNLAVLIKEVRDALDDDAQRPVFVRTVQRFGYAFSGFASDSQARAAARCWLTWGTQRATLVVGENILGRDPASTVLIDVVGVSRRHAMITVTDERVTLTDLGSKNGTFADGQRITEPTPVTGDMDIRLGPTPVRLHRLDQDVSTQTLETSRIKRPTR